MLAGKKILVAMSGGIAAYKIPELVRRLKDQGAEVKVAMTQNATSFIGALTMQAVSGEVVGQSVMDPAAEAAMGHIEWAKWPDLILLAPATANTIAKYCHGLADDLVSTLLLASSANVAVAPAMNQQMYASAATQDNLNTLRQRGVQIWGPASGEQACGDVGMGRMLESAQLLELVIEHFNPSLSEQSLQGKTVVITAGPTREAIDPVRYISNHSSGKMGFALASAAKGLGATVKIISGPVNLTTPSGCERFDVSSALDMHQRSLELGATCDIFIACAAVADYRVAEVASHKIKKTDNNDALQINLLKNPDIVADVAKLTPKPFVLGFAAETQDLEHYARDKMQRKGLDMIAANDVSIPGQGFNSSDNALQVYWPNGQSVLSLNDKQRLAQQLMDLVVQQIDK
ncbi:bifunctional phosphopantothenoylcysteine decarboxylase/phosphopantothenate--cysteine ligase CoaBC [Alginatibacterium sediminis]|uniref:Coenzyme A biosynthesis bifunctional protein CoaBC n=1 Tax=Alginatibacterium sediminis TaxID=2164068 RepID=A0A420EN41_9ALTE|nr:bifunctional phosphopantothenoylcysteine decarboxylase/phosphopantothenate--cysteine ligase CoaBC [Alginatibacterium sediminis]RKF22137.1 bifunctional phosphopantothenoylcysteine decarboxylase/phosphopantothenate--cysteine ligase CoaBC [Alginatibacterium sediminis]